MKISPPPVSLSFDEMFVGCKDLWELSPYLKKMSLEDLYSHVAWHWNHGTMSWAEDDMNGFVGVCLIRLLTGIDEIDQLYVHDPDGQVLVIEEVVSDSSETWRELFEQLYDIWGAREFVVWDRRERTEKTCPRIYTWTQYLKILRRLTHGYNPD